MKTEKATPRVSIIMPVYGVAAYLDEAIQSVVCQTFEDWELLILDDCSTDGAQQIAAAWAARDARIRLCNNEKNLGVAQTRNRGIALARGEYLALLDGDDYWMPEKLERQLALAEEKQADIVYCSYAMKDETGKSKHRDYIVPSETNLSKMLTENVMSCSTVLLKAALLKEHGFETAFYHEDYALWLRLLKDGCCAYGCTQVLAVYRLHGDSRSANKLSSAKNRWRIYREYLKIPFFRSAGYLLRYAAAGLKKYA